MFKNDAGTRQVLEGRPYQTRRGETGLGHRGESKPGDAAPSIDAGTSPWAWQNVRTLDGWDGAHFSNQDRNNAVFSDDDDELNQTT
jgi:hypothetical protein